MKGLSITRWMVALACASAVMLTLGASVYGDDAGDWTLTTADLSRQSVIPRQLDEQGLIVITDKGRRTIPLDRFVSLQRIEGEGSLLNSASPDETGSTHAAAAGDFVVYLVDQDRLAGAPVRIDGERLAWQSPALGTLEIPLKRLSAIARRGTSVPSHEKLPTQDVARLTNGDMVAGIVTGMSEQTLTLSVGGETTPVPLGAVSTLVFAAAGPPHVAPAKGYRLSLTDGSSFVAREVQLSGSSLGFTFSIDDRAGDSSHKIALENVRSIEQVNGPLVWLSSLTPLESIQIPQFTLTWPAMMNRSVTGEPIRFGRTTYDRGIGVHAYSRLRFAIPAGYHTFRTQYAIDGHGALADVTARILLDDHVAYERKGIKAGGELVSPVIVPLDDAKTITLEVDYGKNGDTQDRFNWIEPALLRIAPAPQPASDPK